MSEKLVLKYLRVGEKWEFENKVWLPVELSHYYDNRNNKKNHSRSVTPLDMLDQIIDNFIDRKRVKNGIIFSSASTARGYRYLKKSLISFTRNKYHREFSKYLFHDIDQKFILDYTVYVQYRASKKGNNGGIITKLKYLHAIFVQAKKKQIYGVDLAVFDPVRKKIMYRFFTPKTVSVATIRLIENTDRSCLKKPERFYLDMFLFSFYAGGLHGVQPAAVLFQKWWMKVIILFRLQK